MSLRGFSCLKVWGKCSPAFPLDGFGQPRSCQWLREGHLLQGLSWGRFCAVALPWQEAGTRRWLHLLLPQASLGTGMAAVPSTFLAPYLSWFVV